jgi:hypothetical protein
VEQFFALAEPDQALWNDVGQIVTEVRTGSSLRQASRKFGRDARTILQLARPALRKLRNGRWAAEKHDKLLRVLVIPTEKGLVEIGVRIRGRPPSLEITGTPSTFTVTPATQPRLRPSEANMSSMPTGVEFHC